MELELASHIVLPLLFFIALLAGTVDAIAGGGGLISLPALLAVGVPPHIALGTNKLQGMVGTGVATYSFYRKGYIAFSELYQGIIFSLIGAIVGAIISQVISNDILKKIIPILLIVILLYTLFSPKLGHIDSEARMNQRWFYIIFGTLLGFYDGFFGPGTGSFWIFAMVYFLGFNLIKATAATKVLNLNTNIFAFICFAVGGNIDYTIGAVMALGQIIGGRLGAHLTMNIGYKIIRPVFLGVVCVTLVMLIYQSYF
jgi:uncharacterized membrane protein YfcA